MTWFHSTAVQFSRAWHHPKRRRRWVGFKSSTRNEHRDPKCTSARRFRIVREGTRATSEGATCAWMAADVAVGGGRTDLLIIQKGNLRVQRYAAEILGPYVVPYAAGFGVFFL
ncbi:uncharacterized protein TNCV_3936311 [Trichonephila clavipes]|nr:uncharacterized protein TNCV_3936311 [Trichonephila clavipes]